MDGSCQPIPQQEFKRPVEPDLRQRRAGGGGGRPEPDEPQPEAARIGGRKGRRGVLWQFARKHRGLGLAVKQVVADPLALQRRADDGGGEATAAILGNNVTVGGSGYSEFQQYIESGKMRAIAVTSPARLKGISVPTMKEQGFNVEIGNWRGVYGAPGITPEQRKALIDMVVKATKSKAWAESLEKNSWTPAVQTGKEFEDFVDREFASLRATMVKAGMI